MWKHEDMWPDCSGFSWKMWSFMWHLPFFVCYMFLNNTIWSNILMGVNCLRSLTWSLPYLKRIFDLPFHNQVSENVYLCCFGFCFPQTINISALKCECKPLEKQKSCWNLQNSSFFLLLDIIKKTIGLQAQWDNSVINFNISSLIVLGPESAFGSWNMKLFIILLCKIILRFLGKVNLQMTSKILHDVRV